MGRNTCKVARIRAKNSHYTRSKAARYFSVRIIELSGAEAQIEFENANAQDFELRSKDMAAFIYLNGNLRIVQNFTINKYLPVSSPKCYLATCAYGENSSEVHALRTLRDKYLINHKLPSYFVSVYYRISPTLVNKFGNNSNFRSLVKTAIYPILKFAKRRL